MTSNYFVSRPSQHQRIMASESNNSRQSAETLLQELAAYRESDSLTEEGLREIIERHGLITNSSRPHTSHRFFRATHVP
jgi:hypothetical protein